MSRREELVKYMGANADMELAEHLIDEVVFLEEQLAQLKKLPFIEVHPRNPEKQRATPASRMYVSLMAQYNANIRTLAHLSGATETEEESPLRIWAKANGK